MQTQSLDVYVLSRRDNYTKERHLKRRHPSKTLNNVQIFGFECYRTDINEAKEKYENSLKGNDKSS